MPGLVPGIHVLEHEYERRRGWPGRARPRRWNRILAAKTFFIIFVDAIFTTFAERLFTNVFDVMAQTLASACVYPARTTG
jgi:hypothetical protein